MNIENGFKFDPEENMLGEIMFEPPLKMSNDPDDTRQVVGIWYSRFPEYLDSLGCVMYNFRGQTAPAARWYESFTGTKIPSELIARAKQEGSRALFVANDGVRVRKK